MALAVRSSLPALKPSPLRTTHPARICRPLVCKAKKEDRNEVETKNQLALPLAGLVAAALISGAAMPEDAMAARSGGRVGGSTFRSSPSPSYSSETTTSIRRSYTGSYSAPALRSYPAAPSSNSRLPRPYPVTPPSNLRAGLGGGIFPGISRGYSTGRSIPFSPYSTPDILGPGLFGPGSSSVFSYGRTYVRPPVTTNNVIIAPSVAPPVYTYGGFGGFSFMPSFFMPTFFVGSGIFQIFFVVLLASVVISIIRAIVSSVGNKNRSDGDGWGDL